LWKALDSNGRNPTAFQPAPDSYSAGLAINC